MYGFANGDPVNFSDPFGLCPKAVTGTPCPDEVDIGAGFVPGVSTAVDAATVFTGENPLTGEEVGLVGRGVALAGLLTPVSGGQIRGAGKAIKKFFGKLFGGGKAASPTSTEIVENVEALGGTFKPHPTRTGEGVAVDFGDGTVVDVRVENHPPLGRHANVERFENGRRVSNRHIVP